MHLRQTKQYLVAYFALLITSDQQVFARRRHHSTSRAFIERFSGSLRALNKFDKENCGSTTMTKDGRSDLLCSNGTNEEDPNPSSKNHLSYLRLGQFPSHAIILCRNSQDEAKKCSGTLLNNELVLTKVACLEGQSTCSISLGTVNDSFKDIFVVQSSVWGYCKLPKYRELEEGASEHDAALALLYKPLEFSPAIQPACLDTGRQLRAGRSCIAVGDKGSFSTDEEGSNYFSSSLYKYVLQQSKDCSPQVGATTTCYQQVVFKSSPTLCDQDLGTGLYCLDGCMEGKKRHFVVGLMSKKASQDCKAKENDYFLFTDFNKVGSDLNDMLNFCQEMDRPK